MDNERIISRDGAGGYLLEQGGRTLALPNSTTPEALSAAALGFFGPVPPPPKISMLQARLALHQAGLLDEVIAAIDTAGGEAAIYWAFTSELHRDHPVVAQIAAAVDLTELQTDELFHAAASIV